MSAASSAARSALVELVSRLVTGQSLDEQEREWARVEIGLAGFRRTALALLLKKTFAGRPLTVLAPALGGRFELAVDLFDTTIGWAVLQAGAFEPHVVALYQRVLRAGMTVVDVGANVGFHALHAASLVGPTGRVIAVEPDPRAVALLRLSAARVPASAGFAAIEVVEAALSDETGSIVHTDLGNAANGGARFTAKSRGSLEPFVHGVVPVFRDVRAFRWDDERAATRIDFVKIDIEGHEPFAIRGMERTLAQHRPIVLSEVASSNLRDLGGMEAREYLRWFTKRGYRMAIVEKDAARRADESAILDAADTTHHVDVLFTPDETPAQ